jgi:hypothetical protein
MAGDVDQRLHLLHSPIARTDARCRVPKMTEGLLEPSTQTRRINA